ncbi:MAG: Nif11-like leader peptide family natural product precursor [Nostoc sp.]|uniref:Nif11-like leader peptide family natural product precursor n=1 Tax=Nostoc sp. TaxID=1180 RepID=UPI002FF87EC0
MSTESARAFYQKVSTDEAFANQLRNADSDDQRFATIQAAGYDFTPEEWATVVDQIKQSNDQELSESQLEAVSGGLTTLPLGDGSVRALYGVVSSTELS